MDPAEAVRRSETATIGNLETVRDDLRGEIKAIDQKFTREFEAVHTEIGLLQTDMIAVTRMVRTIMDHLGISEPNPPA